MSTKNSRQKNVRRQQKAERKQQKINRNQQRKVNRLVENAQQAREMRKELLTNTAKVEYKANDLTFDKATEQIWSTSILLGDGDLRSFFGICSKTETDQKLVDLVMGMIMTMKNPIGATLLRYPSEWNAETIIKKASSSAWGCCAVSEINKHPGHILVEDGERFGTFISETLDDFIDWVADCGSAPDENGIVSVDVDSSAISHINYNANDKKMRVTFKESGSIYEYDGVPRKRFCSLVSAPSVGRYFGHNVKDAYEYRRVA